MVTNLLSNARKYSPVGGSIVVGAGVVDAMVEVYVQDEGLGIPDDALTQLFGKFYRVDAPDRVTIKGTGLGLAISKNIVEAHGGKIGARSEGLGKGAIFHFTVPMVREQAQTGDVLVVEDDSGFAHLLEAELAARGLSSIWAADAETAEHLMTKARAVVLDLLLPGLPGEAFLQRLRAKQGPGLPVVVVTLKDLDPARKPVLAEGGRDGGAAQRAGDGGDGRKPSRQVPGSRAGGQLIAPQGLSRVQTSLALPASADDHGRLVLLRQTHGDRVPGLPAGPDFAMPVVRTVSILFTDIRGFSRLTERFADDPAGLLDVLNAHLKRVIRSITICGGVVEKFVGDGVMATFGASSQQPDHVDRAMAAAIGLVGANEALNRRCAADWGFRLEVGVGIASGPVVIGAVGSADRSELGVLGDAVNVAARLVTHAGPGEVLMTGTVYRAVADMLQSELTTQSAVRGRSGALEIYRISLLGGRSALA